MTTPGTEAPNEPTPQEARSDARPARRGTGRLESLPATRPDTPAAAPADGRSGPRADAPADGRFEPLPAEFFRALINRSPIIVTVVDPDGRWRWSSAAGLRLHGEARGGVGDAISTEDRAAVHRLIAATLAGRTERVDVRVRGLDGHWHALTVAAENLLDEPTIRGVGLYATDTTRLLDAEQRVRAESARLDTLISALGVGILLQDAAGRTTLANQTFTDMFGIAAIPDDLRGLEASALWALRRTQFADEPAAAARAAELTDAGEPVSGEELLLADGRAIQRDFVPVHLDGATLGNLWVFHDVTEHSLIRRGLEERNRALAELAALKSEFIATASHELRTPLTSILTFAHLLEEPGCGPAERDRALGAISRNADRMLRLVDDLILLVTLEAGTAPLRLAPVDLPALVTAAIQTWGPVAQRAGVSLADAIGAGPRISADSRHLHQLVDTLLATAVATTPRGGQIEVRTAFEDPTWTLRLDCSSPAATAAGDHMFTRPGRHDDPSAAHSNALAFLLSRAIVARHGGELSSPHTADGASYVVCLPLTPPGEADPA